MEPFDMMATLERVDDALEALREAHTNAKAAEKLIAAGYKDAEALRVQAHERIHSFGLALEALGDEIANEFYPYT